MLRLTGDAAPDLAKVTVRLRSHQAADGGIKEETLPILGPFYVESAQPIDILVRGENATLGGTSAVWWQRSARGVVPLGSSLLELSVDKECVVSANPPTCGESETCSKGTCISNAFSPEELLPDPRSLLPTGPDPCVVSGAPEVFLGTGENTFAPIVEGATLPVYAGNQGGVHILVSVQTKNIPGNGTAVLLTGTQPETGLQLPATSFIVPFRAQGDRCEVTGFRYQLDNGGVDDRPFRGKPLDLKATVRDPEGVSAAKTVRIVVGE